MGADAARHAYHAYYRQPNESADSTDADSDADPDADDYYDLDELGKIAGYDMLNGPISSYAKAKLRKNYPEYFAPARTAAKTADTTNKPSPKKPTADSTDAATIENDPPKPTTAAQINGETTEGEDALVRVKAQRKTPREVREEMGTAEEDTGLERVNAHRLTPK